MKYQFLPKRDLMSRMMAAGSPHRSIKPAYWLLTGLAAMFTVLVLMGINPEPAKATRQLSLQIIEQEHEEQTFDPEPAVISGNAGSTVDIFASINAVPYPAAGHETGEINGQWHEVKIKSGDNLAVIFSKLGIPARQLHKILSLGGAAHNLKRIYPGQTLRFLTNADAGLVKLEYQIDELSAMEVRRQDDDFEVITSHRTPERRIQNAGGIIDNSLFLSAQNAGLADNITMELANIFGWDIDFALDIRKGDQFSLLYEELYLDGEKIGNGNILAAEFVNQGKTYKAVRYTDQSGRTDYYSLDGKSMRKAFLRTPVEFSRISSRFSLGRKHPILNRIRAHKGVDYAAATGTPVKATGDGKIIHRGKKGGYGNAIIIQHGTKYSTLYGHLSKFRGGLKTGSRVEQGQVIGYVGSTGLATGPHLHYELRVDGVHRDPLTVKLPGADPLDNKYRADFNAKAAALIARLDLVNNTQVASNQ